LDSQVLTGNVPASVVVLMKTAREDGDEHEDPRSSKKLMAQYLKKWNTVPPTFAWVNDVCIMTGHKPVILIRKMNQSTGEALCTFLRTYNVVVLNVAGHREWDENPTWQEDICKFLVDSLSDKRDD
jgi:hypothetical protein